jgi:multiple sugar transport system substrate-binding protein
MTRRGAGLSAVGRPAAAAALALLTTVAGCARDPSAPVLTFSGSAVGLEADVLGRQFARFEANHPPLTVRLRVTPDAADERRQLYVHWLTARAADPDVLQLDVIWTPEFAAAGWILALDPFQPDITGYFPAAIAANRWQEHLYALPWFVDVGMLYWRTDLMPAAPTDFEALTRVAIGARSRGVRDGFVWQGARYEGLVTVFLEHLGGFGGAIIDEAGAVTVDSAAAVAALTFMRDAVWATGIAPATVLTWQEEQVRFAFQNGQAALMRNWPYAHRLLQDERASRVAGRFGVAPMPAAAGGSPTAALGGSHLAINAHSDRPEAAYALIEYLTAPEQMLERARVAGYLPARPSLYDTAELSEALGLDARRARAIVDRAVPRPVTPLYSQLSEILQVHLHRALTRQQEPRGALADAAEAMRGAIARAGLDARSAEGSEAP